MWFMQDPCSMMTDYAGSKFLDAYAGSKFTDDYARSMFTDPFWGGALGRPKADIMEAEGRLNGGLGAKPPGILALLALVALEGPLGESLL